MCPEEKDLKKLELGSPKNAHALPTFGTRTNMQSGGAGKSVS